MTLWEWDIKIQHLSNTILSLDQMAAISHAWISINILLKFVPKVQISNIPAFVQIMPWRRPGDKPLSELMMVKLLMHICITRPQWVNTTEDSLVAHFTNNIFIVVQKYNQIFILLHPHSQALIATKFCTWHNSCAVVHVQKFVVVR